MKSEIYVFDVWLTLKCWPMKMAQVWPPTLTSKKRNSDFRISQKSENVVPENFEVFRRAKDSKQKSVEVRIHELEDMPLI